MTPMQEKMYKTKIYNAVVAICRAKVNLDKVKAEFDRLYEFVVSGGRRRKS